MLKYLISTTEILIPAGILLGMLAGYLPLLYKRAGSRCFYTGSILGIAAAIVMAYMKNKTKLIDTGRWNMRIFAISMVVFLLFVLLDTAFFRKRGKTLGVWCVPILGAMLSFIQLFYSLPDVLAYPYTIILGGEALFSTGFLTRVIGMAAGLCLVVLTFLAVRFVCKKAGASICGVMLKLALLVVHAQFVMKILQTLYTRRVISGHTLFTMIKFTSNHGDIFLYGLIIIGIVMPVLLWIRSFRQDEPYSNPAELRKIKANRRSIRRWSTTVLACFLLVVLNVTAIKAYANRPVELSAIEECRQEGDSLYIPFEQVEDGHLHRFAYTTEAGVQVRFIIIKKPNSSAYGVGLDACDICGETGYYERSGQVVCNRCDVVMNINTIGFKGGCNPKVIDYTIENGHIIVPVSTLIEHEADFQ